MAGSAEIVVETMQGPVAYLEAGRGSPVLFVHGSPGGSDQGLLMGRFLIAAGFRVIAPSRPGYLGTPDSVANRDPSTTATLLLALMDALGVQTFGLACWSGGGPSSYHLAAAHPDRVSHLVACAAVSGPYAFASGAASIESSIMSSGVGHAVLHELAAHAPKSLISSTVKEEGHLTRSEAKALTEHIWEHEEKRDFVLQLSATLSGRRKGLRHDRETFPSLTLPLEQVAAPTLLVHGRVDSDVPPEHSDRAERLVPGAEILRVDKGTHICVWTDPTSHDLQARIAGHLRRQR